MIYLVTGLIIMSVLVDQVLKWIVCNTLEIGQSVPLIDGVFHFTYIRNFGAACSAYAFLACGRIHGVSFTSDNPWDYEPGLFLCKMAGAETKDRKGFHSAAMSQDFLDVLEQETALFF